MSDKFTEAEVKEYQKMLDEKRRLRERGSLSHSIQQKLNSGSVSRERRGRLTGNIWDNFGSTTQKLINAGVIDGFNRLTPKAQRSGLHL